ncbi:glycerophosphodiester phosphodiesterase family protein [Halobellus sp. GM3]|uniref:glycerophosphodiester phosphodiesterase family protein n=1 Tax=Halobellus sp. GM3 TaxID=3458410 RepID=UPI00403D7482
MTDSRSDGVRISAHRGCAGQYPENTFRAVELSAPHVDEIEVDVRRCGSGELVVFHDERLDRLTGRSGAVSEVEYRTLRELDILNSAEPIPRLSAVLEAVPADTRVNLELKEPGIAVDALPAANEVENEVRFSSFLPTALREVRDADPTADIALITASDAERAVETATTLGCSAVHPSQELVLDTGVVQSAHEMDLSVYAWTVADETAAAELIASGADGLIVDRWDVV